MRVFKVNLKCVFLNPETLLWLAFDCHKKEEAEQILRSKVTEDLNNTLKRDMHELFSKIALDFIELHLTERCNLDCAYCYIPRMLRRCDKMLTINQVDDILSKIFNAIDSGMVEGLKRIIFHGGEPWINKNVMMEVIDRYHREAEFGVQTNGTLLTEDDIEFLVKRRVHVSVSLDGPPAEIHNIQRPFWNGSGSWDRVVRVLDYFKGYEYFGVIVTLTKYNIKHLSDIVRFLYEKDVTSSIINPVSPSNAEAESLMPSLSDLITNYLEAINLILKLNSEAKSHKKLVIDNVESIVMALLTSNFRVLYCHMSPCGAGRLAWVITSHGDVYPCSEFIQFPEFRCGNVFNDDIKTLINSKTAYVLRNRSVNLISKCNVCVFKNICGANCPAPVYYKTRDLLNPSIYCDFNYALIKHILNIIVSNGLEAAYLLVSNDFEQLLKKSQQLFNVTL